MSDDATRRGDGHTADPSYDDTTPLPQVGPGAGPYAGYGASDPYAGPARDAGETGHTGGPAHPGASTSWGSPPVDVLGRPTPEHDSRRGRRVGAAVLAAALLLGGIGGFAGAAGFEALDDDTGATTGTTRPALDTSAGDDGGSDDVADAAAAADSPEAVAAEVLPSVVKINVVGPQGQGSGSGVVLSADGEILTNNHVVEAAAEDGEMTVDFDDGSSASATVVGRDPLSDLAVIQAEDVSGLTPARIGSSDQLDVGEGVVAIGSPFGLEATVTSGIVSSLNRPVSITGDSGTDTTYPAIQTDAAINPGNSGGPLVNLDGEVVGINSSIRTSSSSVGGAGGSIGLGFAIPITTALPLVEQLRNGETPTHARLGVTVSDTASSNGLVTGAQISAVEEGSAADEAGLESGDIVTRLDDQPITSSEALVATVRGYRPGDTVTLTVRRGGDTEQLEATLGSDAEASDS